MIPQLRLNGTNKYSSSKEHISPKNEEPKISSVRDNCLKREILDNESPKFIMKRVASNPYISISIPYAQSSQNEGFQENLDFLKLKFEGKPLPIQKRILYEIINCLKKIKNLSENQKNHISNSVTQILSLAPRLCVYEVLQLFEELRNKEIATDDTLHEAMLHFLSKDPWNIATSSQVIILLISFLKNSAQEDSRFIIFLESFFFYEICTIQSVVSVAVILQFIESKGLISKTKNFIFHKPILLIDEKIIRENLRDALVLINKLLSLDSLEVSDSELVYEKAKTCVLEMIALKDSYQNGCDLEEHLLPKFLRKMCNSTFINPFFAFSLKDFVKNLEKREYVKILKLLPMELLLNPVNARQRAQVLFEKIQETKTLESVSDYFKFLSREGILNEFLPLIPAEWFILIEDLHIMEECFFYLGILKNPMDECFKGAFIILLKKINPNSEKLLKFLIDSALCPVFLRNEKQKKRDRVTNSLIEKAVQFITLKPCGQQIDLLLVTLNVCIDILKENYPFETMHAIYWVDKAVFLANSSIACNDVKALGLSLKILSYLYQHMLLTILQQEQLDPLFKQIISKWNAIKNVPSAAVYFVEAFDNLVLEDKVSRKLNKEIEGKKMASTILKLKAKISHDARIEILNTAFNRAMPLQKVLAFWNVYLEYLKANEEEKFLTFSIASWIASLYSYEAQSDDILLSMLSLKTVQEVLLGDSNFLKTILTLISVWPPSAYEHDSREKQLLAFLINSKEFFYKRENCLNIYLEIVKKLPQGTLLTMSSTVVEASDSHEKSMITKTIADTLLERIKSAPISSSIKTYFQFLHNEKLFPKYYSQIPTEWLFEIDYSQITEENLEKVNTSFDELILGTSSEEEKFDYRFEKVLTAAQNVIQKNNVLGQALSFKLISNLYKHCSWIQSKRLNSVIETLISKWDTIKTIPSGRVLFLEALSNLTLKEYSKAPLFSAVKLLSAENNECLVSIILQVLMSEIKKALFIKTSTNEFKNDVREILKKTIFIASKTERETLVTILEIENIESIIKRKSLQDLKEHLLKSAFAKRYKKSLEDRIEAFHFVENRIDWILPNCNFTKIFITDLCKLANAFETPDDMITAHSIIMKIVLKLPHLYCIFLNELICSIRDSDNPNIYQKEFLNHVPTYLKSVATDEMALDLIDKLIRAQPKKDLLRYIRTCSSTLENMTPPLLRICALKIAHLLKPLCLISERIKSEILDIIYSYVTMANSSCTTDELYDGLYPLIFNTSKQEIPVVFEIIGKIKKIVVCDKTLHFKENPKCPKKLLVHLALDYDVAVNNINVYTDEIFKYPTALQALMMCSLFKNHWKYKSIKTGKKSIDQLLFLNGIMLNTLSAACKAQSDLVIKRLLKSIIDMIFMAGQTGMFAKSDKSLLSIVKIMFEFCIENYPGKNTNFLTDFAMDALLILTNYYGKGGRELLKESINIIGAIVFNNSVHDEFTVKLFCKINDELEDY